MINRSDNSAWEALNDYLGRDKLENYAHQNGLNSYEADRNVISTADMAQL